MIKKTKKGQVLKKVKSQESFVSNDTFYVPVEMSVASARFFEVEKILVAFIPNEFVDASLKPYHLIRDIQNKQAYKENEIISFENNEIFKSIYSKNIVSSKDQLQYRESIFNVNVPFSDSDIFEIIINTDVDDIVESTSYTGRRLPDNPSLYFAVDFTVRVYALNSRNEVVDIISTQFENINVYREAENSLNQERKLSILTERLNDLLDSFDLLLNKFTFINNNNLDVGIRSGTGSRVKVSNPQIADFFNSEEAEGLVLDMSFFITDNVDNDDVYPLSLFTIGTNIIDDQFEIIDEIKENFNLRCLENEDYVTFITKLYNKCKKDNLEEITTYYKINFSAYQEGNINNKETVVVSREKVFTFRQLQIAYNDITRYNFVTEVKNKRVVRAESSNLSGATKKLKLKLFFNDEVFDPELIYKNSVSFRFYDNRGQSHFIEDFYFNENFTESNYIKINTSNKIENYIGDSNSITLFFHADNLSDNEEIREFYINFSHLNSSVIENISVGPFQHRTPGAFSSNASSKSNNSISEKIVDSFATLTSSSVNSTQNNTNYSLLNMVKNGGSSVSQKFTLSDSSNILARMSSDLQSLGYNTSDVNFSAGSEIINNTLVMTRKTFRLNGQLVFVTSYYDYLSNIQNNNNVFNIENRENITSLLNVNQFDADTSARSDFVKIKSINDNIDDSSIDQLSDLSDDFSCNFDVEVSLLLLPSNVKQHLGSPAESDADEINESKRRLVESITETNPNYNPFDLSSLISTFYSSNFNSTDGSSNFSRKLFEIMGLDTRPGKKIVSLSINKQDVLTIIDQVAQVIA